MTQYVVEKAIMKKVQAVVDALNAATVPPNPKLVLEFNGEVIVDTIKQTAPFITCTIKFLNGYQMNLSDKPGHRFEGQIEIAIAVKEGQNILLGSKLLSTIYPKLQRQEFEGVRTLMADTAPKRPHLGWNYHPILIPFWSDQPTA